MANPDHRAGGAQRGSVLSSIGWSEGDHVAEDGAAHWVELAEARPLRFELAAPVRALRSRRGQRHLPGRWCGPKRRPTRGMSHVMLLDFDPMVVGIGGLLVTHTRPNHFVRRTNGGGGGLQAVDYRRDKPRDLVAVEASWRACSEIGWNYRLVGALGSIMVGSVRWLPVTAKISSSTPRDDGETIPAICSCPWDDGDLDR